MSEITPRPEPIDEQPSRLKGSLVRRQEAEITKEATTNPATSELGKKAVRAAADSEGPADEKPSRLKGSLLGQRVEQRSRLEGSLVMKNVSGKTPSLSRPKTGSGESKVSGIDSSPWDSIDITRECSLPTFNILRPESNVVKTYTDKEGAIDLRLSSHANHQDGLAYNPDTDTIVLCDGLGGIGPQGDMKDFFGFALAHAAAELKDITTLRDEDVVARTMERAKSILNSKLGISNEAPASKLKTNMGGGFMYASTIAAVQRVAGTTRWKVVTLGDSSVAVLDKDGRVREGFGEAFQLLAAGRVDEGGTAADAPIVSLVGITKESLKGGACYSKGDFGSEFTEVELAEGEKLVIVSDAYVQKTNLAVLESDAALSAAQWKDKKPLYADDTTMAVIAS